MGIPTPDLTGQRFGHLIALRKVDRPGHTWWHCQCDCGEVTQIRANCLRRGQQRCFQCGSRVGGKAAIIHGMSGSPEWLVWKDARRRCNDPKYKAYPSYGGRGIVMCQEWRDGFAAFFHDMGPRPTSQHMIERINNDGPYSPDNCKWATRQEQNSNKRNNRIIEFRGERKTLTEWGHAAGMHPRTFRNRLYLGWTMAEAFDTPVGPRK